MALSVGKAIPFSRVTNSPRQSLRTFSRSILNEPADEGASSLSPRRRVHFQLVQSLLNCHRSGLHPTEIRVQAVRRHQFFVRPALDNMTALQDEDLVGIAYGGQPMRDDKA